MIFVGLFRLVPLIILGIIIYLIVKRLRDKDDETFEKRDN